jgi:hypothetical protein
VTDIHPHPELMEALRGDNPGAKLVYALIFNGVTHASSTAADGHDRIRLSERERIAKSVYDELRAGGIEVRLPDGLASLRYVNDRLATGIEQNREMRQEGLLCGAFQPLGLLAHDADVEPYRCTEPRDHQGPHEAAINGTVIASWERLP